MTLLDKLFKTLFILTLVFSLKANAQGISIEATTMDSIDVTLCDLPYNLNHRTPGAGETALWTVTRGEAAMIGVNGPNLIVEDVRTEIDTVQFLYTISDGLGSTVYSDLVTIAVPFWGNNCPQFIDFAPSSTSCGSTENFAASGSVDDFYYSFGLWYSMRPTDEVEIMNPNSEMTDIIFKKEGTYFIDAEFTTNHFSNIIFVQQTVNVTCASTLTQANAGPDFTLDVCEFPAPMPSQTLQSGETANWEVLSGQGVIGDLGNGIFQLDDCVDSTVFRYTITDGSTTTADTLVVRVNDPFLSFSCGPDAPLTAQCGETFTVEAIQNYGFRFPSYVAVWMPSEDALMSQNFNELTADFMFDTPGNKSIVIDIETPGGLNRYTEVVSVDIQCDAGTVTQPLLPGDFRAQCDFSNIWGAAIPAEGETILWTADHPDVTFDEPTAAATFVRNLPNYTDVTVTQTITNAQGLSASASQTISTVYMEITDVDFVKPTCGNNDGSITITTRGESTPFSFTWNNVVGDSTLTGLSEGTYNLVMENDRQCMTIERSFYLEEECADEKFFIEGFAWGANGANNYNRVILMDVFSTYEIDVTITSDGFFRFDDVEEGTYTIAVIPFDETGNEYSDEYLPTYYVNKASHFEAHPIYVTGDTYSVDVQLIEKSNAGSNDLTIQLSEETISQGLLPTLLFDENDQLVGSNDLVNNQISFDDLADGNYYMVIQNSNRGYIKSGLFNVSGGATTMLMRYANDELVTGVSELEMASISASPNPCQDVLTIDNPVNAIMDITIYNIVSGEQVYDGQVDDQLTIDTNHWSNGSYIIKLQNDDLIKTTKLIKL